MVSPKWETVWVESQHCSKSIVNVPVPSQQTKKILEDLKNSCCSPNKAVQAEALKCWGLWIHNQNPDDWKLNSVCFSAVRPLITKKLQPLHNDVDICKLKLSLMWALLVKVQEIMELEGPQYILEVFLQSCLTWLSFTSEHGSENEVNFLIFQLLLAVFNKNELLTDCDKKMFPPLSTDILHVKKVFHRLADKFLNIFIYWRKVDDSSVVLKIWKYFLEHCELSYEHIPIPVWHKIFKLTGQICSEKESPIKERLAFLHSCATTLKSALSSSKFIDFGNLLTTPCEVLLKKLVELCTIECDEVCDSEMFLLSKEICQVLSDKSVPISGYNLCIYVVDFLEEFHLRSLFWGVWCGLVYCYKALHRDNNQNQLSKSEIKFYRKLRGVVLNFELDRNYLHEDCIKEVEKHIEFLNISCKCWLRSDKSGETEVIREELTVQKSCALNKVSTEIVPALQQYSFGKFSVVSFSARKKFVPRKIFNVNFHLLKDVLSTLNPDLTKSLLGSMFTFRFVNIQPVHRKEMVRRNMSVEVNVEVNAGKEVSLIVSCQGGKAVPPLKPPSNITKKNPAVLYEKNQIIEMDKDKDSDVITTPKTRSKKRAEEEREKELEMQKRKKRKSFEVLVQEIVRKNKERKTEKNIKRKKNSDAVKSKRRNKIQKQKIKNVEHQQDKESQKIHNLRGKKNKLEISDRKLRNHKKEEPIKSQKKNEKTSSKTVGKLENYFKVITKKSNQNPKESKKPSKARKCKKKTGENSCCDPKKEEERKGEIGWKQTSLKTMMNQKSKLEKVGQRVQTREKTMEIAEKKPKLGNSDKKVLGSPLTKLSPFKEVLHDHEYAKINPENLKTFQSLLVSRKEKSKSKENSGKAETDKILPKSKVLIEEKANCIIKKDVTVEEKTLKINKPEIQGDESIKLEAPAPLDQNLTTSESKTLEFKEGESTKIFATKELHLSDESKKEEIISFKPEVTSLEVPKSISVSEEKSEESKPEVLSVEENLEVQSVRLDDNWEECTVNLTPEKRTRKRIRIMDSLKPRKKFKSEEEEAEFPVDEKLPLEITEKENLEENQKDLLLMSPVKKENTGDLVSKSDGTPKMVNGGMSRALRIIRLVPESTVGLSWESYSKVEALKCKKAPNVDKNSRASKMLALLTENMVETEEIKSNEKEINSSLLVTTPNTKTLSPSLKSPKSVKKRKSIRFDDTRNETVVYQIDTPPSQILEEKGKRKEMRSFELALLP